MGLFSFLPWVDDEPKPKAPTPQRVLQPSAKSTRRATASTGSLDYGTSRPAQGGTSTDDNRSFLQRLAGFNPFYNAPEPRPNSSIPSQDTMDAYPGRTDEKPQLTHEQQLEQLEKGALGYAAAHRGPFYYTGEGQPYDPVDVRDIVDRLHAQTPTAVLDANAVTTPTPTPTQTMVAGGMSDQALLRALGAVGRPTPTGTPSPTATATPTGTPSPTATPTPTGTTVARGVRAVGALGKTPPTVTPSPTATPTNGADEWSALRAAIGLPPVAPATDLGTELQNYAAGTRPALQAPNSVEQLLRGAGWKTPERPVKTTGSTEGLDMSQARELKRYDYSVTPEELAQIEGTYTGREGYAPGRRLTEGQAPKIQTEVIRSAPMTWEAYNALSDDQRRAVDFNTLLVEAREKDIGSQNPTMLAGDYTAAATRVFGEKTGGTTKLAPATVNLLDKMGIQTKGQDLDEFLSLDRAITTDELKDFKPTEGQFLNLDLGKKDEDQGGTTGKYENARSFENLSRFDTANIQKAGEFIASAMKNPEIALWNRERTITNALGGGRPPIEEVPWGWAMSPDERTTDADRFKEDLFQRAYLTLKNRGTTNLDPIWAATAQNKFTDADTQELFQYFDDRSRWEEQTGVLDPDSRTPAEIRQLAGLGG